MQIQINFGDVDASPSLRERAEKAIEHRLEHLAPRITRVEVHLRDDNAGKAGKDDKRCVMEARPANHQPIAVEHRGDDLYKVIDETADKLSRAVRSRLERAETR